MYSRLCHEHVLFECPALVKERVKRWTRVIESMPAALISSIECMNASEKLVFILSGLNCEYVSEWRDIYEEILFCLFFSSYKNNYSIGDQVLFSIVCNKVHCKYDLYCIIPDGISSIFHSECVEW